MKYFTGQWKKLVFFFILTSSTLSEVHIYSKLFIKKTIYVGSTQSSVISDPQAPALQHWSKDKNCVKGTERS